MIAHEYDIDQFKQALWVGGIGDLRFACDFADRIVSIVEEAKATGPLRSGFRAYRARPGLCSEEVNEKYGTVDRSPWAGDDIAAPPTELTSLGRFNPPRKPALYLATTKEVALAETRALSSDTCTVAILETVRELKIAMLMAHNQHPWEAFIESSPKEECLKKFLLSETASFVSRRVPDHDRDLHYRACNLIASAFQARGYEGLLYRTSFWSDGWFSDGKPTKKDLIDSANLVLFDVGSAIPKSSALYRIDWQRPEAKEDGGGHWTAKEAKS